MSAEKKALWKCHKCRERRNSSYHILVSDSPTQKQRRNDEDDELFDENNKRFKDNAPNTKIQQEQTLQQHQQQNISTSDISEAMKTMMLNMSQMTAQLSSISMQLQNQQATLMQINDNVSSLSSQVSELQKENREKDKRMYEMETKISKLEQKVLEKNIEINNLNNNNINAVETVEKIAAKLNVQMTENDIDNAYLTKGKTKLIVEFSSLRKKREIMDKIERHRIEATDVNNDDGTGKHKYIYINDQLTASKRHLLWMAKNKASDANWKFVWVKHGEIYARKIEKSPVVNINCESDLQMIC
ncbi:putative leucine-rich repeat-containing protein DDB_G0290503 [Stomoxys calcitrans]|nr:putative leucine-rich repeat-containing protein DDB_G0290503 [Stomoxys calcitrans]XP_059223358.1 putative leucine-rich repeat-containing protein DDB_G0290503 [Stomoxys calcitrans]